MRRFSILLATIFLAGLARALPAQTHPDFSGEWVLLEHTGSADAPESLVVRQIVVDKNVFDQPMPAFVQSLSITKRSKGASRTELVQISVQGGTVGGKSATGSAESRLPEVQSLWSGAWRDDHLIMQQGTYRNASQGRSRVIEERIEEWSLDTSGRLLVKITEQSQDRSLTTSLLIFGRN